MTKRPRHMISRLIVGYIIAFGIITLAIGEATFLYARHELDNALDARLAKRMANLVRVHQKEGLPAVVRTITRYEQYGGHSLSYRLSGPDGRIIDDIPGMPKLYPGWGRHFFWDEDENRLDPARTYTRRLADGATLTISADRDITEHFDEATRVFLISALGLLGAFAIMGGVLIRRASVRRMRALNDTARQILEGHLDRRVPVSSNNDEMDAIARTVNVLLDRMNTLLKEMRRVSRYVAHDMRAPMVKLHDHLINLSDKSDSVHREGLDKAITISKETIALFTALLRLGDIDPVLIKQTGEAFNFSNLVSDMAESYVPVAHDRGYQLRMDVDPEQWIFGDRELLTQVLVNLIENGLVHTPLGSVVAVNLRGSATTVHLSVTDNGNGMPEIKRQQFLADNDMESAELPYRNALGLRLVLAIVHAHSGKLKIKSNDQGTAICATFPRFDA